jgi:hypothetical protein
MAKGPEMQGILDNIGYAAMFIMASPTIIDREGICKYETEPSIQSFT